MQYEPRENRRSRRRRERQERILTAALILAGISAAAFGLVKLAGYGADLSSARQTAREMRDVYYAEAEPEPQSETTVPSAAPAVLLTAEPEKASVPEAAGTSADDPGSARAGAGASAGRLPASSYPGNPGKKISTRFKALRAESRYIVGWLKAGTMLDEPVVQLDDVFFMDHDAKGNANVNGAVFLDSMIGLNTRPYTYTLYGHNMKSGAMFGCLRNYEQKSFYRNYPFITYDTMYEDGEYVIFAVSTVSTDEQSGKYLDFHALRSTGRAGRQTAIDTLIARSVHPCVIDVQPEDQLLILVTCVDQKEDRRVIAARRLRDGENRTELKKMVGTI